LADTPAALAASPMFMSVVMDAPVQWNNTVARTLALTTVSMSSAPNTTFCKA
jgi:hypothetical protein